MNGIIILNKPAGFTSMDCCAIIRKLCGEKRVGHTGTLDPNATGVLPICVGKATRLIEYMEGQPKTYVCGGRLGLETDTQDIWGSPAENRFGEGAARMPSEAEFKEALLSFQGKISQIPPMYSAIKINGQRLYDIARSGGTVERKARQITVYSIRLLSYNYPDFSFEARCSKGTYIRTVCADLGEKLGCGAVMTSLVRTEASGFKIAESVNLDELRSIGPETCLKPWESAVSGLERVSLSPERAKLFRNGNPLWSDGAELPDIPEGEPAAVLSDGVLLGVIRNSKIEKVFN